MPPATTPAAIAALEAGKHVLVEKPLFLSLADADDLVSTASASPGVATVGFNLRSLDLVRRAHWLVRPGSLAGSRPSARPSAATTPLRSRTPRNGGGGEDSEAAA